MGELVKSWSPFVVVVVDGCGVVLRALCGGGGEIYFGCCGSAVRL